MIRCVGAVVHDTAGRLLLIKRGHAPGRGLWSLPGGRVEAGETDEQAVARELLEETGLTIRAGVLVGRVERPAPGGVYEIFDYAAEVVGGSLAPGDDADGAAWVGRAEFAALEASGELVAQLADTLREWDVLPRS
ncbi:MAG TPA: NUDIX domain-containing protein [Actinophytocola sp.]|uniref:NUDIX hydrolase n=1 Tax=Actinophytocola sp. TaxID=1872138 RepID=UPI002F9583A9